MTGSRLALVAAVLLAGCAPGAGRASPSVPVATASPAASAAASTAAPDGTPFVSSRYGYALVLPARWTVTETPGQGGVHPDEPGVDTIRDPKGHILSIVGQPAVPALTGWVCAIGQHLTNDHHLAIESTTDLTLDGEPARLRTYHLTIAPYVIFYQVVEVVDEGRGLTLSLESTAHDDTADATLFRDLLGRFAFS